MAARRARATTKPLLRAQEDSDVAGDKAALERLTAFSDAVVAIAITLIVLPLVDRAMDAASAGAFFAENTIALVSALLSFLIVGGFWRGHHRLMSQASGYTPAVMGVEFLWLAAVVFLPVATALDFAGHGADLIALSSYFGTLLVASVTPRVQRVLLERAGLIMSPRVSVLDRWLGSLLLAVAFALVLAVPSVGPWWLLLLLIEPLARRLFGR
ncbi:MAG: TMEM175 family protein [Propioniciclava sp.]